MHNQGGRMDAVGTDPPSVHPGTMPARVFVAVAYFGLYLLAARWANDIEVLPGITPWFPAAGLTVAILVGFGPGWLPVAFAAELASGVLIYDIDSTFTTTQVLLNTAVITGA